MQAPKQRVVVEDVPDSVIDRLKADVFPVESLTEEAMLSSDLELTSVADPPNFEVSRILWCPEAARIDAR
jgi:hypothetical protein